MKPRQYHSELHAEYKNLLGVLTSTEKYLESLAVDPAIRKSYRQLLRYLRSQSSEGVSAILGQTAGKHRPTQSKPEPTISESEIREMSFEKIREIASDSKISRKLLERIATLRFGVTRGGLSTLRTRDALVGRLQTLVSNEEVHDSIRRAVGEQPE